MQPETFDCVSGLKEIGRYNKMKILFKKKIYSFANLQFAMMLLNRNILISVLWQL